MDKVSTLLLAECFDSLASSLASQAMVTWDQLQSILSVCCPGHKMVPSPTDAHLLEPAKCLVSPPHISSAFMVGHFTN